mmetsp:Transcript_83529/g.202553  ORF Transcript_83529/g.202553 Transcript_83529/m.202553 type:complete len:725 (+) Transcript_83529:331-2505(+)
MPRWARSGGGDLAARVQSVFPQFPQRDINAALCDADGHVCSAIERLLTQPDIVCTNGPIHVRTGSDFQMIQRVAQASSWDQGKQGGGALVVEPVKSPSSACRGRSLSCSSEPAGDCVGGEPPRLFRRRRALRAEREAPGMRLALHGRKDQQGAEQRNWFGASVPSHATQRPTGEPAERSASVGGTAGSRIATRSQVRCWAPACSRSPSPSCSPSPGGGEPAEGARRSGKADAQGQGDRRARQYQRRPISAEPSCTTLARRPRDEELQIARCSSAGQSKAMRRASSASPALKKAPNMEVLSVLITGYLPSTASILSHWIVEEVWKTSRDGAGVRTCWKEHFWTFCTTRKLRMEFMQVDGQQNLIKRFTQGVSMMDRLLIVLPSNFEDVSWLLERAVIAHGMGINGLTFAVVEEGAVLKTRFERTVQLVQRELAKDAIANSLSATFSPVSMPHSSQKLPEGVSGLAYPSWYRGHTLLWNLCNSTSLKGRSLDRAGCARVWPLFWHMHANLLTLMGKVMKGSVKRGQRLRATTHGRDFLVTRILDPHDGAPRARVYAGDCVNLIAKLTHSGDGVGDGAGPSDRCSRPLLDATAENMRCMRTWELGGEGSVEASSWVVQMRVFEPDRCKAGRVQLARGLDLLLCAGCQTLRVRIAGLINAFDLKTQSMVLGPETADAGVIAQCLITMSSPASVDVYKGGRLGRFSVRRSGVTVGVGRVLAPVATPRDA